LLEALNEIDKVEDGKHGEEWPKRAADLGKKIKALEFTLADGGMNVTVDKGTRVYSADGRRSPN
jgi:hypothetical protein